MDWSDGSYEHTATTLELATEVVLDTLGVTEGMTLLDLGCGTGNAAIEAAKRGARVTAVDPAKRLLAVARERAAAAKLSLEAKPGEAAAIPAESGVFDAAVSVFAVIFAPDAAAAAAELIRVVKPGGRIVISAWQPVGGLFEAGRILRNAVDALVPADVARSAPSWGDPGFVRELFGAHQCYVEYTEHELWFEAESADAWFSEQERHHPVWRGVKAALADDPAAWERVRAESVAALRAASDEPVRLHLSSPYLVYSIAR